MADPLFELLVPYFQEASTGIRPSATDPDTSAYLAHLSSLSLPALTTTEPQSISQSSHANLRSLQDLSKRSHKPIITATDHLGRLGNVLPSIGTDTGAVQSELPRLESAAHAFAEKYGRAGENAILERRRKAMLLARNVDRVADVLDLPTLLSSVISASATPSQASASATATASTNYASALDLYAHIKRLSTLYPNSPLVASILAQADQEMKVMTSNLILALQSQGIKLAGAMRTVGWLRRVAPELDETWSIRQTGISSGEGSLGATFLVCRLACLESMLAALDPLRELADQETTRRLSKKNSGKQDPGSLSGPQTEKYLKKYLEIFREQSFAITSMYKSIFPSALPPPEATEPTIPAVQPPTPIPSNPLQPLPSALSTFPLHLVELLFETLRTYLPNVQDRSSRDSLLTQVLYCAGSLGRLGGDFSLMIALLEEDLREDSETGEIDGEGSVETTDVEEEWVDVMKKHRVQASRLELLASGVGSGRPGNIASPA